MSTDANASAEPAETTDAPDPEAAAEAPTVGDAVAPVGLDAPVAEGSTETPDTPATPRPEQSDSSGQADLSGELDHSEQPRQPEQPGQSEQPDRPEPPAPSGRSDEPAQSGQSAQSAQSESVLTAATLHSMDEESARLAADLDEAREAVRAAHQADQMSPVGEELPPGEAAG